MIADSCQQFCSQLSAVLLSAVSSSALNCQHVMFCRFGWRSCPILYSKKKLTGHFLKDGKYPVSHYSFTVLLIR